LNIDQNIKNLSAQLGVIETDSFDIGILKLFWISDFEIRIFPERFFRSSTNSDDKTIGVIFDKEVCFDGGICFCDATFSGSSKRCSR
jgi:hypothetical protein